MEPMLRRYTELPYVIDLLQTKELVLLNPASWDDSNDSYYIEQYTRIKGLAGTFALCLTQAPETYHHWKIFSHGSGGACIVFDKIKFMKSALKVEGLRAEEVQYKTIAELRSSKPKKEDLPFLKRYAYIDEKELRLILGRKNEGPVTFRFSIPLSAIDRITLSPWLPKGVVENVKKTLKSFEGCSSLHIYRSTLVDNEKWKGFAANCVDRQSLNRRTLKKPAALDEKTIGRSWILYIDRYRRMVANLWLAERNVNQEMIAAGIAEAYVEYLKKPYRAPFIQAEKEDKSQGRGVWSQGSRYERPSKFRTRMGS